jgi:ABC-type phosphate transport system auxiliary subunit
MTNKVSEADISKIDAQHEALDRQKMKLLEGRLETLKEELSKRDTKNLKERIKNCQEELDDLRDTYEPKKGSAFGDPVCFLSNGHD